jgi:uncharacterized protein (TIGR02217 family)
MKSFIDERFPVDIGFGSVGGPEFATDIVTTSGGHEQRNISWNSARIKYNVAHGVRNIEQMQELIRFFRSKKGRAIGFRFKDWADYQINNQQIATGNGVSKEFQIIKTYQYGDSKEVRIIHKPVENSVKVLVNGQLLSKALYEINYSCGKVIFNKAPKKDSVISVNCEFDVPVRFDTDILNASIDDFNSFSTDVSLIELKLYS